MTTDTDKKIRADWSRLTEKQQTMVREFMKNGNKLAAYTAAFYSEGINPEKTKPKSVQVNCYKEFKKPHIAIIIEQIQQSAVQRAEIKIDDIIDEKVDDLVEAQKDIDTLQIDAMWVLKRAALLANFNINKFIQVEGKEAVYDFSMATEDDWYCIQEYVADSTFVKGDCGPIPVEKVRLKSFDKLRALELVGKHVNVGAFKDKLEISGDEENPIQTITRQIIKASK
jgi:hypothetical protein